MMNCENVPKEIVQSFIDLVNMAKWLMDENQQPSVTQELGRLFPSIRGRGKRGKSSELFMVGAGESSALATDTNNISFQLIQIILVLQHGLPQNRRLKKYGDQRQHQRNH